MNLDEEFRWARKIKEKNYGKLVQMQKRLFDEWAVAEFAANGFPGFKMAYMPFIMNIGDQGIINKELASMAHVSKQAMSKVIRELEELGLVASRPHASDARMTLIQLTDKGKRMVITAATEVHKKMKEYEKLVGKERFRNAMETMYIIVEYEKQQRDLLK